MLHDTYQRTINYLRVSITDRCNLRCEYCRPKEGVSLKGHEDILSYEDILRVISAAVRMGLIKVRLTGGEPLLRRDFVDFVSRLAKIEGLQDISLTTNGILLENMAEAIYKAGLRRVNISLDSMNPDRYRKITRGGDLKSVLRGIAAAEKAGFSPIKINVVAIKGFNDDEVLDFARLAANKPFQIRFIELMPISEVNTATQGCFLPMSVLRNKIMEHYQLEPLGKKKFISDGPAEIYRLSGGLGEIGFIHPVSSHFCATCNRLRLTADGKLRACLLRDEEIDLKKPLSASCDDDVLQDLISQAILLKPAHHDLDCTDRHLKKCHRDMSDIGG
ncbi:MAG TPA: GTP 3',8-cyclase MoaA [Smithellaceae bacterium]|nr:GTP 3',8-cyclase MoaA [Smithellaceae bacterium]